MLPQRKPATADCAKGPRAARRVQTDQRPQCPVRRLCPTQEMKVALTDWVPDKATVTTAIGEVSTGVKSLLNYSSGTSFKNYSTVNTWTVRGLKSLRPATTSIESPPFTHQNSSSWCMVLTKNADGLHLSFLLKSCATDMFLYARVKANEVLCTGETREVCPWTYYSLKQGQKSNMLLVRKNATPGEGDSQDDITLQCTICIQCIIHDELPVGDMAEPQVGVVRDTDEMLHKEVHTDFEIHAEGKILKAHKGLLSVRSPYFAALLQPHTKEAQEGIMQVSDVKPEVLKQILMFMYTGVAPGLKDMPWDLLIAADKYQLQELKSLCETHIASCLNVDNVAGTAVNAHVFSCDMLWDRAVVFIKRNLCSVVRTPGWTEAITTHPEGIKRICELVE